MFKTYFMYHTVCICFHWSVRCGAWVKQGNTTLLNYTDYIHISSEVVELNYLTRHEYRCLGCVFVYLCISTKPNGHSLMPPVAKGMTAFIQYSCNSNIIFIIVCSIVIMRLRWKGLIEILPSYQGCGNSPVVTVGTDRYFVRDVKSPPAVCVCQLGDRTGSSACRKWKICRIVSKLCSGCAPSLLLLLLPFPHCSLVWSCVSRVSYHQEVLSMKTQKNLFDFTGRLINSVNWESLQLPVSLFRKMAWKRGKDKKKPKHFCVVSLRELVLTAFIWFLPSFHLEWQ